MALGATIYKAQIDVSDLDRGYYGSRLMTLARHPSETESRLMVRILAYCLYAGERVQFGRGLSSEDEPALWEANDAGDIGRWIDVGVQDNKALRRAAGRSDDVVVLVYDDARIDPWWQSGKSDFGKIDKLSVRRIHDEELQAITTLASRSMQISATIQDGIIWLASGNENLEINTEWLMRRGEPVF